MATATLDVKLLKELGFDNCRFGRGTDGGWNYSGALHFAERDGGRLQSAREAVVVRVASDGVDQSREWQHTGDWALYFRQGGLDKFVFVNGYDFRDRLGRSLISRCQEGDAAHRANREWYLSMSDFCPYDAEGGFSVWMDELAETGRLNGSRVFDVPDDNLWLNTQRPSDDEIKGGAVYFGNHPIMTSLLTPRVAEVNSGCLSSRGVVEGSIAVTGHLGAIHEGSFLCRNVGLNEDTIIVNYRTDRGGRSRSVFPVPSLEVSK